jgi:transposase InsO family protein
LAWSPVTVEDQRLEFVRLASQPDANRAELCRRFGISRKTGYKWLGRLELSDQSRRPLHSPTRTPSEIEARVVEIRQAHPAWGGRKIAKVLQRDASISLSPNAVTCVLHRHGLICADASEVSKAWTRFEHPWPNSLWQIDFKGHFAVGLQRCHPLTVVDDHSRFNVVLQAMPGEAREPVQAELLKAFGLYGLPDCINADNGPPWGSGGRGLTELGVWLIRLGISLSHSRPHHPQTNGKDERFHRTLKVEVLCRYHFQSLDDVQQRFDHWRTIYNCQRPHEAIGMQTPADRYSVSPKLLPKTLRPIEYGPGDEVRRVQAGGIVKFAGRRLRTSMALHGEPVALRPLDQHDGVYDVFYCHQRVDRFDLNEVESHSA